MIEINHNPSRRELRQFAVFWFPAFFGVVGLLVLRAGHTESALAVWAAGALTAAIGMLVPRTRRALYLGVMYAVFPIGFVVSNLLLLVVYYGVFTPVGLLLRLIGKDSLARRRAAAADSYWVQHRARRGAAPYFKQY